MTRSSKQRRNQQQIPMGLALPAALGRSDFFVSPANARALAMVDHWKDWPEGKLVLLGPPGAGKTHLASLWAEQAGARVIAARDLAGSDPAALISGNATRLAVEDAAEVAGNRKAELALFHLHNVVRAADGSLLLTAHLPARRWGLELPDLASRMEASASVTLEAPDDSLLGAVLVKLFADRQLVVEPAVIAYLLARMERSLAAAGTLVEALDRNALAEKRAVTRRLAADVLESIAPPGESGR